MGLFSGSSDKAKKYKRKADKYKKKYSDEKIDRKHAQQDLKEYTKQPKDKTGSIQQEAARSNESMNQERQADLSRGRAYSDEVLGRRYQGLNPQQKLNQEEGFQQNLDREMHGYGRQLAAQQGQAGVRGGTAYAQQSDLNRMGLEQQQENQRNLSNLDSDLALKKAAAAFAIEQGEASQSQLARQQAASELRNKEEMRRQQKYDEKMYKLLSSVGR